MLLVARVDIFSDGLSFCNDELCAILHFLPLHGGWLLFDALIGEDELGALNLAILTQLGRFLLRAEPPAIDAGCLELVLVHIFLILALSIT